MAGTWCPDCRAFMVDGTTCPECRRRKAWGTINAALVELLDWRRANDAPCRGQVLNELEAVAMLMQERQALLHRHRKDMMDEQRAASRGAGEAFDRGRDEGRREGRGDW